MNSTAILFGEFLEEGFFQLFRSQVASLVGIEVLARGLHLVDGLLSFLDDFLEPVFAWSPEEDLSRPGVGEGNDSGRAGIELCIQLRGAILNCYPDVIEFP